MFVDHYSCLSYVYLHKALLCLRPSTLNELLKHLLACMVSKFNIIMPTMDTSMITSAKWKSSMPIKNSPYVGLMHTSRMAWLKSESGTYKTQQEQCCYMLKGGGHK